LTSGYLNGEQNMGYMKRGGSDHIASTTKSPQFHRPSNYTFHLLNYNRFASFSSVFLDNQLNSITELIDFRCVIKKKDE
jgi:hypothetical protein